LTRREIWARRKRTLKAMAALVKARLTVAWVPFERWRNSLGATRGSQPGAQARQLAADIEWAAKKLPFDTKCLPRAMALSWMLRRRGILHAIVFAVRPREMRDSGDALHAWVEVEGVPILGYLPGPWIETTRLGE
jgi:hypothetical protein